MNEDKPGVVSIHGNDYETVALRVTKFREDNPNWTIKTKAIGAGQYVTFRASIYNEEGRLIATGHAEEERGAAGGFNGSELECCETSAVGRALAFYKFPGTFLRSADEMSDALIAQGVKNLEKWYGEWMKIIREPEMLGKILTIKDLLSSEDDEGNPKTPEYALVAEMVMDMTDDQQQAMRKAPTKGGILTTEEIGKLKSNEYADARNSITGHVRDSE